MNQVKKGLQRRGQLLSAALRPPGIGAGRAAAAVLPAPRAARRVERPVFVLSCQRSGSTLLRVLLNSHSQIRSPHELHLNLIDIEFKREFMPDVLAELELDAAELRFLVWDYVLGQELDRSGKSVIVDKTPANSLIWRQLRRAWPGARFIFLLRHPAAITDSVLNRRANAELDEVVAEVLRYGDGLEAARRNADGITVRYEELTTDPEGETRRICEFLELPWEAGMLDYGSQDHGPFKPFFGDWSANIKSGEIKKAREVDSDIPEKLRDLARAWGYLD